MSYIRRLLRGPSYEDIVPTDWVRKIGQRGVGCIESVTNDHALVDWLGGTKEIIPTNMLRRARGQ